MQGCLSPKRSRPQVFDADLLLLANQCVDTSHICLCVVKRPEANPAHGCSVYDDCVTALTSLQGPFTRLPPLPAKARRAVSDSVAARLFLEAHAGVSGTAFLQMVDGVFKQSLDSMRDLSRFSARGKYVLRKLAFALLSDFAHRAFPCVKSTAVRRERFVRETLGLLPVHVACVQEGKCDNAEAHRLLTAMYRLHPHSIRVPSSFRSRVPFSRRCHL